MTTGDGSRTPGCCLVFVGAADRLLFEPDRDEPDLLDRLLRPPLDAEPFDAEPFDAVPPDDPPAEVERRARCGT